MGVLERLYLAGEDLDLMLPGSHNGFDDGAANIASAACNCDDGHGVSDSAGRCFDPI